MKIYKNNRGFSIIEDADYKVIVFDGGAPMDLIDDTASNDNVDVEIVFNNGGRYAATFFTLKNVESLMHRWVKTKEHNAKYFWASDAIIVEELNAETIHEVIKNLISLNDLSTVCLGPLDD